MKTGSNSATVFQIAEIISKQHIWEVISTLTRRKNQAKYIRLNRRRYLDKETGIIKFYKSHGSRDMNVRTHKIFVSNLSQQINRCFSGSKSEKHVVLTYAFPMENYYGARMDFKIFQSKFTAEFPDCSFLHYIEPQADGGWKINLWIKTVDGTALYIPYETLCSLWGFGPCFVGPVAAARKS